jgi:thioredoxin reductase (NADPH)
LLDCVILGGGPAGLTAALYLARFNRSFILIDGGDSRAAWIPESHNIPLFSQGIAGSEILRRQRAHAEEYGARIVEGTATELAKTARGFALALRPKADGPTEIEARFAILATGVSDISPPIPDVERAVERGLIRYCPICDGYEARGKKVGVIGIGSKCLGEAAYIARTYSDDVSILSFHKPLSLNGEERERLEWHGIHLIEEPVSLLDCKGGKIVASGVGGLGYTFDVMYSALGVHYRSALAKALGTAANEAGALVIGAHSETSTPGLYAVGDVTEGLNQIVVGMGQAAKAATHIHNQF